MNIGDRINTQDKPRIEYVDIFRAFGILFMIMGHIRFGGAFDKWIHAFHMPMFFFASGWFFRSAPDRPLLDSYKKKCRSLLLPYISFGLFGWALNSLLIPEYRTPKVLYYLFFDNTYKIPVENVLDISPVPGALWFLTALFFTDVIYITIDRLVKHSMMKHILIAALALFGMIAPRILPTRTPWALGASLVGLGFFHIAYLLKHRGPKQLFEMKLWQVLPLGAIVSVLIMINPGINMRTGAYDWYPLFWTNALAATVVGWNLSRMLETALQRTGLTDRVARWLKGIGKNSIIYLCLNQTVILFVKTLLYRAGVTGIVERFVTLVVVLAILFAFEKLFFSTKLKFFLGK